MLERRVRAQRNAGAGDTATSLVDEEATSVYVGERGLDTIVGFFPARHHKVEQFAYRTAWRLRSVLPNVKAIDLTLRSRICMPWFR